MTKENILFGIIGLLIGSIVSFVATNSYNRSATLSKNVPDQTQNAPKPPSQNSQPAAVPAVTEALDKAEKEPENFEAQVKAGEMFARINNFEKAIPYFEKAQQIKPNDHALLVMLGNTNFDLQKWENAEKWYEKALVIKPDDVGVRTDLGITFIQRENTDYERAIKEFEQSLRINPNHEATIFNMALAYFKKGDTQKASEYKAKLANNTDLTNRLTKMFAEK
jgi:tetratricopeptide (TPR) repeat protein